MNIVVRKLQPRPNKKSRDDDDESSNDSTDDDNDNNDDDEYGLGKDYISNNVTPVGDFTMTPDEFNVDHVYDIVRGFCFNVYRKNNNIHNTKFVFCKRYSSIFFLVLFCSLTITTMSR